MNLLSVPDTSRMSLCHSR